MPVALQKHLAPLDTDFRGDSMSKNKLFGENVQAGGPAMTNAGKNLFRTALDEIGSVLARADESRIDTACAMLAGANKIVVYGCGREALQVKGFAMRLHHLAGVGGRRHDRAAAGRRRCLSRQLRSG